MTGRFGRALVESGRHHCVGFAHSFDSDVVCRPARGMDLIDVSGH
jgi:hypothetical protein